MSMEAGFIGLGSMGLPMAANLVAAEVKLRVHNRTGSKAEPLVAKGAVLASKPADVAKLTGNFLIAAALESMAEAYTMAEANGVDRVKVAEMLGKTLFACPVYQRYGEMVASKRHTPAGFALKLGLKDVDLVLKTAGEAGVPTPVASVLRDRLIAGIAHGREEMDWSALALGVLDDAGIK
jgi:3-hydroxyisobutyrate dehydrogenase-like beta-hydroxyacid dehydrogenase